MGEILEKLGDDRFSTALSMERPEVRTAVGGFLEKKLFTATQYPRTMHLLDAAPKIVFPLDQSYRDEAHSPLLQKFEQFEERGTGY
jgi:hypothetical protein